MNTCVTLFRISATTSGSDATTVANYMGQWVLDYGLDGKP